MQIKLRIILLSTGIVMTLLSQYIHLVEAAQFKMLIFSLILLGVPHGALDLYIEKKNMSDEFSKSDKVLFKYLLNIIVYALLWYISPIAALLIFILITAFHFGEIDWMGKTDHRVHQLVYFLLGLCWIVYFLSINVEAALQIFLYLGASTISEEQWLQFANQVAPIALSFIGVIYCILFVKRSFFYHENSHYFISLLQLLLLLTICHYCPLWIGFGFYFGLWHSILSFDKIRLGFNMPATAKSWIELIGKAMPFSIMAWVGMLFVMFMFYSSKNSTSLVTLLFITLSVLTLPHLQVFTKLKVNASDKTQE
jgi:hypothetical protein